MSVRVQSTECRVQIILLFQFRPIFIKYIHLYSELCTLYSILRNNNIWRKTIECQFSEDLTNGRSA